MAHKWLGTLTRLAHTHTVQHPPADDGARQLIADLSALVGRDHVTPYTAALRHPWRFLALFPWLVHTGAPQSKLIDALQSPYWKHTTLVGLQQTLMAWCEAHATTRQPDPVWYLTHSMASHPDFAQFTTVIDQVTALLWPEHDLDDCARDEQRYDVVGLLVGVYVGPVDRDAPGAAETTDEGLQQLWRVFEAARGDYDGLIAQWHEAILDLAYACVDAQDAS